MDLFGRMFAKRVSSRFAAATAVVCFLAAGCAEPTATTRPAGTGRPTGNPTNARRTAGARPAAPDPSLARTHRVGPDDTLYGLAQQYYGNGIHWRKIFYANRNRITNPKELPVGMKLIIPPP